MPYLSGGTTGETPACHILPVRTMFLFDVSLLENKNLILDMIIQFFIFIYPKILFPCIDFCQSCKDDFISNKVDDILVG